MIRHETGTVAAGVTAYWKDVPICSKQILPQLIGDRMVSANREGTSSPGRRFAGMKTAMHSEATQAKHADAPAVLALAAILLLASGACDRASDSARPGSENQASATLPARDPDWQTIENYLEEHAAWLEVARKHAVEQDRTFILKWRPG